MHKFKTNDQKGKDYQLQGWHLDLVGMQLNWFLKSKSQMRTDLEIDTFSHIFILNETTWKIGETEKEKQRKIDEKNRKKQRGTRKKR